MVASKSTQRTFTEIVLDDTTRFFRRFGLRKTVYLFFEELATLIKAGIPLTEALENIKQSTTSKRLRKELSYVSAAIEEGATLSEALEQRRLLPTRIYVLLTVGEKTGKLSQVLETIVLQNEKELRFSDSVRSSLLYVVIVLTMAIVVGIATPWIILPHLTAFFTSLDAELPLLTRILISTGEFFQAYGFLVFPLLFLVLVVIVYFLFSFPQTRFIGHSILFHIPVSRRLIREAETARFGYLLGTQLDAGIPITQALHVMVQTTTYRNYVNMYKHLEEQMREGFSLSDGIDSYPKSKKLLPSSARQLIRAGEYSGSLSKMCISIGQSFEEKIARTAKNIPTILEPVLLIFVGGIVVVIALGILQPIYNLSGIL